MPDYRRAHVPGGTYFFIVNTDYIHWNPVKHGYVAPVSHWPYSSFHRYVKQG